MSETNKTLIIVGIIWISFWNITRVVWKMTETGYREAQEVACLQGGGEPVRNGGGFYIHCKKKP